MGANVWKTEYHCRVGRDAVEWCDSFAEAASYAAAHSAVTSIEAVTSYLDDTQTVWERPNDD